MDEKKLPHTVASVVEVIERTPARSLKRKCAKLVTEVKAQGSLISAKNLLCKVRKHFPKEHPAWPFIALSKEDYQEINQAYHARLGTAHGHLLPLNVDDYVQKGRELLGSNHYLDLAVALIAVTGRRPYEIVVTGNFTPIVGKGDESKTPQLLFSGQAKTRGAELAKTYPYAIPVLAPPSQIIDAFEGFRSVTKDGSLSYESYESRYRKPIADHAVYRMGMTSKTLRAAYGEACAKLFKPRSVSPVVYLSDILGHRLVDDEAADMVVALSYLRFAAEE